MEISRIDLHVHTAHSGDNDAEPEEMLRQAIARRLDGIAFTEHYSYEASEFAVRLKARYKHAMITILRGVEFSALEGHCLVFGADTDKLTLRGAPVAELVRIVNEAGGVVIPSHPFRRGSGIGERMNMLPGIAAVEGYNGCNPHSMNVMAINAANAMGLPFTGGSDAHAPSEVGNCFTVFQSRVTEDNFIDLLRAGQYTGHDERKISRYEVFNW